MLRFICGVLALVAIVAMPLAAQEEQLIGAWELKEVDEDGEFFTWVIFREGGQFELRGEGRPSGNFFGEFEDEESLGFEIFPEVKLITIDATGTWRTSGDSLYTDVETFTFLIDGLTLEEFNLGVAKNFARNLADLNGIPDEAYPAFEEEVVQQFMEGAGSQDLSEELDDAGTYAIEGDVLTLTSTDENGLVETEEFRRVPLSSSVSATSWGRLKANWGR